MKSSSIPLPIGLGAIQCQNEIMSSNSDGWVFFKSSRIPALSNWNTPKLVGLRRQQGVRFGIVERDTADVNCNAVDLFDQFDRLADDRQSP